jgi:chemotaxis protein CheX
MKVEYINPFITTTVNVFATMLSCKITRVGLKVKERLQPEHEISGIIGLSGRAAGTVVLSLSRNVALSAASEMIGEEQNEINDDVADVIGELANMVAGGAKAQLTELEMSVSLPSVIIGKNHIIMGSSKVQTLSVLFSSAWGPLNVDVSLLESTQMATNITLD